MGIVPKGQGPEVTRIRETGLQGADFTFRTASGDQRGIVLGNRLAERLGVVPGADSVMLIALGSGKLNPVTGLPTPRQEWFEVTGVFATGMYEYDNSYGIISLAAAQELT